MLVGNKRDRLGMVLSQSNDSQKDQLNHETSSMIESCKSQKLNELDSAASSITYMSSASDNDSVSATKKTNYKAENLAMSPVDQFNLPADKETCMKMMEEATDVDGDD